MDHRVGIMIPGRRDSRRLRLINWYRQQGTCSLINFLSIFCFYFYYFNFFFPPLYGLIDYPNVWAYDSIGFLWNRWD